MKTLIAVPEYDWDAAEAEMAAHFESLDPTESLDIAGWLAGEPVPDWTGAVCAEPDRDPRLWDGKTHQAQQAAISICQSCPISGRCLEYGSTNAETGVWGGVALAPIAPPAASCSKGHADWRVRPSGRRECRQCAREARKRREGRRV